MDQKDRDMVRNLKHGTTVEFKLEGQRKVHQGVMSIGGTMGENHIYLCSSLDELNGEEARNKFGYDNSWRLHNYNDFYDFSQIKPIIEEDNYKVF